MEKWSTILERPNYQVSNIGRVKRLAHRVLYRDGRLRYYPEQLLRPGIAPKLGYPVVVLTKNKQSKTYYVHLLVAECFLPPKPTPKHEINHKDGNKANSCATNLEWKTHAENMQHSIVTGLRKRFSNQYGKGYSRGTVS